MTSMLISASFILPMMSSSWSSPNCPPTLENNIILLLPNPRLPLKTYTNITYSLQINILPFCSKYYEDRKGNNQLLTNRTEGSYRPFSEKWSNPIPDPAMLQHNS